MIKHVYQGRTGVCCIAVAAMLARVDYDEMAEYVIEQYGWRRGIPLGRIRRFLEDVTSVRWRKNFLVWPYRMSRS